MNKDILCRPFPAEQIRQRPGQHGKTLSYVDIAAVITRLNEGCDSWSFEVVEHHVHDQEVVVLGRLTADGVIKSAFGGSAITTDSNERVISLADDLKAASSDALKKCASLLGIALELYGGAAERRPAQARTTEGPADSGQHARPNAPVGYDERLTSKQLAAIHGAARRHNVSRDHLAVMVEERTGKQRVEHLSKREASDLLSELDGLNGRA